MSEKIKIGFIGLNPDSHWANMAHIPALKTLEDEFEIIGVANSTHESAKKTAKAMNLKYAFETPKQLIECEEIDLVVVTVKVPYHFEYIKYALENNKNVHSEWPLANGIEEAKELVELTKGKNLHTTVGNQMRTSVEVEYLKELISNGYVGKVLSTTLVADGGQWGSESVADLAYLSDKSKGATMLTIPFGHTLAGISEVLGDFEDIAGRLINRRDKVYLTDTNETIKQDAADQIMANGVLKNGAAFSAHYRGGMSKGTNFLWEINGTEGIIQVKGDIGHGQFANFSIYGAKNEDDSLNQLKVPEEKYENLPSEVIPRNVSRIYKAIASDFKNNTKTAPQFEDALKLHKLLDDIQKASKNLK